MNNFQSASEGPVSTNTSTLVPVQIRRLNRRIITLANRVNLLQGYLFTDDCADNPCKNGGKCQDLISKYYCTCLIGWEVNI